MPSNADILNQRADDVATIKRLAFWISSCILFGIAVLATTSRVFLKLRHKLTFGLDDYVLFFAAACLIAGTGVLYLEVDNLYIGPAIQKDPALIELIDPARMHAIFNNAMKHQHTFFTLLWTSIFAVKFSFLIFFKGMLHRMKGMTIYWSITVIISIPSWAVIVAIPFAICPHFGADSVTCMQNPKTGLYTALMAVGGTLDSITDLMLVSIPILVLRRVSLPTQQKIAIGFFLCLSLMMIVMTLIRSAKIHGPKGVPIDITWAVYWVHIEACVAVIMASLTAFRTVFNLSRDRSDYRDRMKKPTSYLQRLGRKKKNNDERIELQVPRATLTGMRTFIRGDKRGSGESTIGLSTTGNIAKSRFEDDDQKSHPPKKDELVVEERSLSDRRDGGEDWYGSTLASTHRDMESTLASSNDQTLKSVSSSSGR